VNGALKDAGLTPEDLDMAVVGNATAGLITGQEMIRGQVVLREAGIGGIEIINVENACAGGSTALHTGWMAIHAGIADIVLCLGVEKLTHENKAVSMQAFSAAVDVEQVKQIAQRVAAVGREGKQNEKP